MPLPVWSTVRSLFLGSKPLFTWAGSLADRREPQLDGRCSVLLLPHLDADRDVKRLHGSVRGGASTAAPLLSRATWNMDAARHPDRMSRLDPVPMVIPVCQLQRDSRRRFSAARARLPALWIDSAGILRRVGRDGARARWIPNARLPRRCEPHEGAALRRSHWP
jgi:hypothetical protein